MLLNPYKVIQHHYLSKSVGLRIDKYNALIERAAEIGDESLAPPAQPQAAAQQQAPVA